MFSILDSHISRKRATAATGIRLVAVLLALLITTLSSLVEAADLRVRIFERSGKAPLEGASVCLGTSANITQFGSRHTDSNGFVVFSEVPRAPLVVTASMRGHKGEQKSLVTSTMEQLLVISLPTGGGGPECTSGEKAAVAGSGGLMILNFGINKGAGVSGSRQVVLNHSVNGRTTHYRASEQQDFSGARWLPYTDAPGFELSPGTDKKVVYLQVRRYSEINGADIQTLSPVVHDSIRLEEGAPGEAQ